MRKSLFYFIFLCLLANHHFSYGQKVLVSEEINIRNDNAYEILGKMGDQYLLFRDKGRDKKMIGFNENLEINWERDLKFDDKKIDLYGLSRNDSCVIVFYGHEQDDVEYLKAMSFDAYAQPIDTIILAQREKNLISQDYFMEISDDQSKTLLYFVEKQNFLSVFVFDNKEMEPIWEGKYEIEKTNLNNEMEQILVTDAGEIFLLLQRNNTRFKREEHQMEIIHIPVMSDIGYQTTIPLTNKVTQDQIMSFDNQNKRIALIALYHEKDTEYSEGYSILNKRVDELKGIEEMQYIPFTAQLIEDTYGNAAKASKGLKNFVIADMKWRRDGGLVLISEMFRELSRRGAYDTSTSAEFTSRYSTVGGWRDYYYEDVIVISIDSQGYSEWTRVFYKRQHSQDDNGAFSSFFLFETQSRLRLIYNDEIRNDNTVSEYVFSPVGQYKRQSVMSTEYQKLRLRFPDAVQLSSSSMMVPSEKNGTLRLVIIDSL